MNRTITPLVLTSLLALSACGGRFSDSGFNPLGWLGGGGGRITSLEPEGGYAAAIADPRAGIAQITSARWEPLNEGRLLVVSGMAPTKGYWSAELVSETPDPTGRLRPGADGVLRLRFVAVPPPADSTAARSPASPDVDEISAAVTLSNATLAGLSEVVVTSAGNVVSIRR